MTELRLYDRAGKLLESVADVTESSVPLSGGRTAHDVRKGGVLRSRVVVDAPVVVPPVDPPPPSPVEPPPPVPSAFVETLKYDMTGTSERIPLMNTGWDFVDKPKSVPHTAGRNVLNTWGQLAEGQTGNLNGCNAQLSDIQLHGLKSNGQWVKLQHSKTIPGGALYASQTYSGAGTPSLVHSVDGTMIHLGPKANKFWHFWTNGFYTIDSSFVGGFSAVRARLDPATPQLHADANYVLSCAADQRITAQDQPVIPNIGIGRFKIVTPEWQWFTMTWDSVGKSAVWASTPAPAIL